MLIPKLYPHPCPLRVVKCGEASSGWRVQTTPQRWSEKLDHVYLKQLAKLQEFSQADLAVVVGVAHRDDRIAELLRIHVR